MTIPLPELRQTSTSGRESFRVLPKSLLAVILLLTRAPVVITRIQPCSQF